MEQIELRPPFPVDPVEPHLVAPDPGEMGQMYIGAREAYPDGMTLACATPRIPYQDVKAAYVSKRDQPGFSDVAFFNEHFEVTPPDAELFIAEPGQTLDEYTLALRPKFIHPNTKQGHFDVWLPYDRAVAGAGRFGKHSFLWDGYQMAKGYAADGRLDLVRDVIDNTEYQINRFGYPLNGSADFYATRSQPDYFSHEVRMLADRLGPEVLVRYLPALEKLHMGYWMDGLEELSDAPNDGQAYALRTLVRMPDGSFLNRYWDDGDGPRLESYKEDVEIGELAVAGLSGALREQRLQKVYKDLRAGAASGWDYSSRWFKDGSTLLTINTTDIAPVDLNSLLAYSEETLAMAYMAASKTEGQGYDREECIRKSAEYLAMASRRTEAINKYLWDPNDKIYRDYNFVDGHQTGIVSAAMTYPLYVGISSGEQALGVANAVERDLLFPGGVIATTTENSTQQWDGGIRGGERSKNVWAPPNWAAVRGFARMGHIMTANQVDPVDVERLFDLAETVRVNYMNGIQLAFEANGVVPEKHRGDHPEMPANGGEYALVKVLGMPSETWRAMKNLDVRDRADHVPFGHLALKQAVAA